MATNPLALIKNKLVSIARDQFGVGVAGNGQVGRNIQAGAQRVTNPIVNYARNLPQQHQQVNLKLQPGAQAAKDFVVGAAQDIPRSLAAVTATRTNKEFVPTGRFQQNLYGKETILPVQRNQLSNFARSKGASDKLATNIGMIGLGGTLASNLIPGGKGAKQAGKKAIEESLPIVGKLAKKLGDANLKGLDKEIETKAFRAVEKTKPLLMSEYEKRFGNVVNTDSARELFPEYAADRSKSNSVHEPASFLSKEIYQKLLKEKKGQGNNKVVFSAGGTGSGKSFSIENLSELDSTYRAAPIVYDGNLAGLKSSTQKIEDALKNGYKVSIIYVDRDPVKALAEGALPRAMRMGRTVPLKEHVSTHLRSRETLQQLAKKYTNNPNVAIEVVDNNGSKLDIKQSSLDNLAKKRYNEEEVARNVYEELESQYQQGNISETVYKATLGDFKAPKSASAGNQAVGSLDDGQLTPQPRTQGTGARPLKVGKAKTTKDLSQKEVILGTKERQFATSAKDSINISPGVKKELNDLDATYNPKANKVLVETATKQIKKSGLNASVQDALEASDMSDEGVTRAILIAERLQGKGRDEEAAKVIIANATRLTEAGRAVQAASLLNRMTGQGLQTIAARQLKNAGKELTGDQAKIIKEMMDSASKLPEGSRAQNLARQKAFEYVRNLTPSPLLDQISSVWKAGLLTGLKTTGLNVAANTSNQVLKKASDPLAAALDAVVSLRTGQRTKTATMKGIGQGARKGVSEGWDYLTSGYDPRSIGNKMEEKGTAFSDNILGKVGKAYTESVFRFIGSQDRPFYYSTMYNSLYDQALAASKNLKVSKQQLDSFVKNFVDNPPENAAKVAAKDAERAVFQNDTALGTWGQGFAKSSVGRFIMPFLRTPSAVATEVMNYTPIGAANTIIKNARKGQFDQREFVEGLSKGITGTGVLAVGWALGESGAVNTAYPKGEKERALWEAEGRQANRLVIGNTQIDVQSLGPAGALLVAGATAAQARKKGDNVVAAGAAGISNTLVESPFLSGVSDVIDLTKDPIGQGSKYIARQTGSVVPSLVSDIAQVNDRDESGKIRATKPEGAVEGVMNRVPGQRNKLTQKVDVFGNKLSTNKNTFQTLADPLRSQSLTPSAVTEEMRRLSSTGNNATPTRLEETQTINKTKVEFTPKQLVKLQESAGTKTSQALESMFKGDDYKNLSDDEKTKAVDRIVTTVRATEKISVAYDLGLISEEQAKDAIAKLTKEQKNYLLTGELVGVKLPKVAKEKKAKSVRVRRSRGTARGVGATKKEKTVTPKVVAVASRLKSSTKIGKVSSSRIRVVKGKAAKTKALKSLSLAKIKFNIPKGVKNGRGTKKRIRIAGRR